VVKDMLKTGIAEIRRRTDERAARLYAYIAAHGDRFSSSISEPALRSKTTAAFAVAGGSAPLVSALRERGVIVGSGYGVQKESHIRISNFPAHTDADFETLYEVLDAAS
ncbi:MAG: phosphoserine aminotransferase, partial [Patescibacteria group bacterium]